MTRHKNVEKGLGTFLGLSPFWFIHSIVTRRSSTAIKNNTWMKRIQPITLYFTKMPATLPAAAQIHQKIIKKWNV